MPEGPMSRATQELSSRPQAFCADLAMFTADLTTSSSANSPPSGYLSRFAPKVFVYMMSAPASR